MQGRESLCPLCCSSWGPVEEVVVEGGAAPVASRASLWWVRGYGSMSRERVWGTAGFYYGRSAEQARRKDRKGRGLIRIRLLEKPCVFRPYAIALIGEGRWLPVIYGLKIISPARPGEENKPPLSHISGNKFETFCSTGAIKWEEGGE